MVTVYTLTPANAAQALQEKGLEALGITTLALATGWSSSTPAYDDSRLSLSFTQSVQAPWRGILEFLPAGHMFRNPEGNPYSGPVAVLRLHPQAAARLQKLAQQRYGVSGQPLLQALPVVMVIHGWSENKAPQIYEAGLGLSAGSASKLISFHDHRGLIIDPIAVAAMLHDLADTFSALRQPAGAALATGAGSLQEIANIDLDAQRPILAHVVTLHGRAYVPTPSGPGVNKLDNSNNPAGALPASGLLKLGQDEKLAASGASASRLKLAWAGAGTLKGGTLAAGNLAVPALPAGVTLTRRFVRVFAVDLDWHLLGNRSATAFNGIPPDDQLMPTDLKPQVRDGIALDYLVDGPDTLGAISEVAARMNGNVGLMFAVSPVFESAVGTPTTTGQDAHWPAFPGPDNQAGFSTGPSTLQGAEATRHGAQDVIVTLPAALLTRLAPVGASLRIYPQSFQSIAAIGEAPSFIRGDGGAGLVLANSPLQILLPNPFALAAGDAFPSPATLVFDVCITPRKGKRRLLAAQRLSIAPDSNITLTDAFASPDPLTTFPDTIRSISPTPLFGLPRTVTPPSNNPASVADLVRSLMSETSPRQGPRLPMMMRHETMVITGISDGSTTEGLAWDAVLTGGRWARETRSTLHGQGNPGNPAGPDTHAAGVRVGGALAYDLARMAVRRVQPMLPLSNSTGNAASPGWIAFSGGNNFNPPVLAPATPIPTASGVALQTVAAVVETPELSLLPVNNALSAPPPISLQSVVTTLADAFNLPPPSVAVQNSDRLINEVRREYYLSKYGNRDALWAIARAFGEADELVYVETAGLARTAAVSGGTPEHEIDLIKILADRLNTNPRLKLVLCLPRATDFAPRFAPYVRGAIQQRTLAVEALQAVAPARVAVFHPLGFPGRWANIRTTNIIVDDVWSLSGATHLRRRGMTFDGSVALATLDHEIEAGYSRKIRHFRRALMAAKLGVSRVDEQGNVSANWIRLQSPDSAFDLVDDLLKQGGLGKLAPLWAGPTDSTVIPAVAEVVDPDGKQGALALATLASWLSESE